MIAIRGQYEHGGAGTSTVWPDGWTLDAFCTQRWGVHDIQFDLFLDYPNNVKL